MSTCEFASIKDAFGVGSFTSQEPPALRGDVAEIHDSRHKKVAKVIHNSHEDSVEYPGAPSCFGAGNPSEIERCPAGTTHPVCQACARRHPCTPAATSPQQTPENIWDTATPATKRTLTWYALRDFMEHDGFLLLALMVIAFLVLKK